MPSTHDSLRTTSLFCNLDDQHSCKASDSQRPKYVMEQATNGPKNSHSLSLGLKSTSTPSVAIVDRDPRNKLPSSLSGFFVSFSLGVTRLEGNKSIGNQMVGVRRKTYINETCDLGGQRNTSRSYCDALPPNADDLQTEQTRRE